MIVSRKTFWICTWAYAVYNVLVFVILVLMCIPGTFIDSLYPGLSKALSNFIVESLDSSVLAELLSSLILTALLIYLLLTLKFKNYVKEWVFITYFFTRVSILAFLFIPLDLFSLLFIAIELFLLFTLYRNYPSYMISPPKDGDDKEKEENYDNQAKPTVSRRIFLSFKILLIIFSVFVIFSYVALLVFVPTIFYDAGAAEFGELYEEFKFFKEVMMILGLSTVSLYIAILFQILILTFVIAVLMLKNIDTRMKEWAFAYIASNILYFLLSSFFNFHLFSASFYAIVLVMAIIWQRNYRYYDYGISSTEKALNE